MMIGIAVAGLVVVGGVGLLLGQVLHNDKTPTIAAGGTGTPSGSGGGTTGTTQPTTGTTQPTTETTQPTTETTQPTTETTQPTTETTQPAGGGTTGGGTAGGAVALGGGLVNVPVPAGWDSKTNSDNTVVVITSGLFYAHVEVLTGASNIDQLLAAGEKAYLTDGYSQLQVEPAKAVQPSGTVTSVEFVVYLGQYSSTSGSNAVVGTITGAIRQDGTEVLVWLEAGGQDLTSAGNAYTANKELGSVLDGTLSDFSSR